MWHNIVVISFMCFEANLIQAKLKRNHYYNLIELTSQLANTVVFYLILQLHI